MATVRLSDVFVRPVYESYTALNSPERTALFSSGLISTNAILTALARAGNKTGTVPFWNDLDSSGEPDYTNDDPADIAVPDKITTGTMQYRKAFVHKAFSSMDLVAELMGVNPLQQIRNRFGVWWTRQLQKRLVALATGVMMSNIEKNNGDMVVDISGLAGEAAQFNAFSVLDAEYSFGDNVGALSGIAVHSMIAKSMAKKDMLETEKDSQGNVIVRRYGDKVVVIDDSLPVEGTGADRIFTSILFGSGAFGFGGAAGTAVGLGEGTPENPSYQTRDELRGNGGGQEIIGERNTWLLHPFGFSWNEEPALVEFSPTLADLRDGDHWTRVVESSQAPMRFLRSKAA